MKTWNRVGYLLAIGVLLVCLGLNHVGGFVPLARSGGVIHVAPTGDDSYGNGSAAAPYRTIQRAVDVANSEDTIKVAQGTYTGTGAAVVNIVFGPGAAGKNLTIIGGYMPPDWDTPSTDPNTTVIDAQGARRGICIVSVPDIRIEIRGMTVQNGLVDYRYPIPYSGEFCGAGLLARSDHPSQPTFVNLSLSNMIFRSNRVVGSGKPAVSGGGVGLYQRCRATLQDVTFEGNEVWGGDAPDGTRGAYAIGGGLFATVQSDVVAKNVTFIGNKAIAGSGGRGYGANEYERADALGGAAALMFNAVTMEGVTASGNEVRAGSGSAYGGFGAGGALFFEYSTATVTNGLLQDNTTVGGDSPTGRGGEGSGGAIMATDSILTLERLTMFQNSSLGGNGAMAGHAGGGAMYFTKCQTTNTSRVTGTNLIMAVNKAEAGTGANRWGGGGAVFSQNTELTLKHVTMAGNSILSSMMGAALVVNHYLNCTSSANISHSIIADHPKGAYPCAAVIARDTGDVINLDHTLFWQNAGGNYAALGSGVVRSTNERSGDPRFLAPGPPDFDYHITRSSAAYDQGNSSTVNIDIDGDSRPMGSAPDIGADEYHGADLSASWQDITPNHLSAASEPIYLAHTITLKNTGAEAITLAVLTDTLSWPSNTPISIALASGPDCTNGTCRFDERSQSITWEGSIPAWGEVTITYATEIYVSDGFTQTVWLSSNAHYHYTGAEGTVGEGTLTSQVLINGKVVYLPLIFRAK